MWLRRNFFRAARDSPLGKTTLHFFPRDRALLFLFTDQCTSFQFFREETPPFKAISKYEIWHAVLIFLRRLYTTINNINNKSASTVSNIILTSSTPLVRLMNGGDGAPSCCERISKHAAFCWRATCACLLFPSCA